MLVDDSALLLRSMKKENKDMERIFATIEEIFEKERTTSNDCV